MITTVHLSHIFCAGRGWCFSFVVTLTFIAGAALECHAQAAGVPVLERRVSVSVDQSNTEMIMKSLERQADFVFSYRSGLIDLSEPMRLRMENVSVREVLDMMFRGRITARQRDRFLILTESRDKSNKKQVVQGYVTDRNGRRISNATVYDPQTLVSTNTDEYGYYTMEIELPERPLQLEVRKPEYQDTLVPLESSNTMLHTLVIEPDSSFRSKFIHARDSAIQVVNRLTDQIFPSRIELDNVDDTLYRDFQLSLVPFVGTNRKLSGHVINKVSVNIYAGYARGVDGFEIGGLVNLIRDDVRGAQMAGLSNIVGGKTDGVQLAGLSNINLSSTCGLRMAGCMNYMRESSSGASFAGLTNVNRKGFSGLMAAGFANVIADSSDAVQVSGFSNVINGSSKCVQISGFSNVVNGRLKGVQVAGFTNVSVLETDGVQLSGFGNVCAGQKMSGVQIAGFFNVVAGEMKGGQLSGFINVAGEVKGWQLGVFNVSDTISGVPVGFLSFVRRGYHVLELGTNDLGMLDVAFRTGVRSFYTFLSAGMDPFNGDRIPWQYGYGIGTSPHLGGKLYLQAELSSHHLSRGAFNEALSLDNRLSLTLELQLGRHFSIFGGPVYHGYLDHNNRSDQRKDVGLPSRTISEENWETVRLTSWLGWRGGLRIG